MKKTKTTIRDISVSGEGIGTSDDGVLFVDDALIDEEVLCNITVKKKNYSKGNLLEILKASEHRIEAPCQYFSECGGCQIQHADKTLQERIKRKRVSDALVRIAKVSDDVIEEFVSSPQSFGYRNKVILPLISEGGVKKVGFFKKRSHEIVSIDTCILHVPFADEVYAMIKKLLLKSSVQFYDEKSRVGNLQHLVIRSSDFEKKLLIGLIGIEKLSPEIKALCKEIYQISGIKGVVYGQKAKAKNSIYPRTEVVVEGEGSLQEEILGVKIGISLLSFFQVNKGCAEKMYQKAFDCAGLTEGQKVLDAYCGIGSFGIFLGKQGLQVTGIESFGPAVKDAKRNAFANHVKVRYFEGEVEKQLDQLGSFDCIFVNPPRKGLHIDVIDVIKKNKINKIVYTSCDPATLARDVKLLAERGYELKKVTLFDMFPQTLHVESVALIEKKHC